MKCRRGAPPQLHPCVAEHLGQLPWRAIELTAISKVPGDVQKSGSLQLRNVLFLPFENFFNNLLKNFVSLYVNRDLALLHIYFLCHIEQTYLLWTKLLIANATNHKLHSYHIKLFERKKINLKFSITGCPLIPCLII